MVLRQRSLLPSIREIKCLSMYIEKKSDNESENKSEKVREEVGRGLI